ncbi:MAG: cyclase family protein, partial [Terriglobia bacterium]
EHSGTHVDAPAHFISDAKPDAHVTIDQVPVNQMVGRGARLNCRNFREGDYVSRTFVAAWEAEHGALREGDIVLFDFGWAEHWRLRPDHRRYIQDWPGVSMEAAQYLVAKPVAALGVDTLSPDPPEAHRRKVAIHPIVLEKQVLIIENLANLGQLPDFFLFLAFPLKIRGGSGSPVRAVAFV